MNDTPQPVKLEELVEYQEGAVVSRTIIKHQTGSVTVFAFDQGQELSEHTVPYDAFVSIIDGEAELRIAGVVHTIGAGEAIVMPAGKPHAVRAVRRFTMVLSMVRAS